MQDWTKARLFFFLSLKLVRQRHLDVVDNNDWHVVLRLDSLDPRLADRSGQ